MEVIKIKADNKKSIRDFIEQASGISMFEDGENIFESGIVNSLFSMQLVTFLEKAFEIEITMDDLDFKNFESIEKINAFVGAKTVDR